MKMLCIVFCTALVFVFLNIKVRADEIRQRIEEEEKAVEEANSEKEKMKQSVDAAKSLVGSLKSGKESVEEYIEELDGAISRLQGSIESINEEISANEIEKEKTEKELDIARAVCDKQYEDMKKQLRFIYRNRAGSSMAGILFSASGIGDLLNKATYIEALSEYDKKKLEEYKNSVEAVRKKQDELDGIQKELEAAKEEKLSESEEMEGLIEDKQSEIAAYDAEIGTRQEQIDAYEKMIAEQDAQIKALEAALANSRKALEEAERPKYDGGMFTFPCPGYTRISDDYGMRIHPTLGIEKMHNGVDFAAPAGTPILAAYNGVVIGAGYSSSMGNYVMIDHGDDLISIYMHASSLLVSSGQQVSAGEKIALVGSTGRSTGPHLHFGVRKDGQYVSPWNYLK